MSNLLEEAIVDAKALKEAALKSAQETILEKYNPEVKKAVEALLLEQDEAAPGDIGTEEPLLDPDMDALGSETDSLSNQVPMAATAGMNLCPCPDNDEVIEIDFGQLQKAMMQPPEMQVAQDTLPAPMTPAEESPAAPDVNANVAEEVPEEEPLMQEEAMDEEIEISEELINSILEDQELFEVEGDIPETDREKELAAMAPPKDKITKGDVVAARIASGKKDLDEDARLQPSQDAVEAIKDKKTAAEIARIAADLATKMVTQQLRENKKPQTSKKQLNEVRALTEKTSQLLEEHKKVQSMNKLLTEENARLQKENQEMQASALEFAKQVEQMNVQNAKLYYKNQALSSVSLNERQKNHIVEAISKADSVDEVKIIFETLQSTVGSTKSVKEPKSLSEAISRNSSFSIRSREKEEPASVPTFDRWSRLAGIKK